MLLPSSVLDFYHIEDPRIMSFIFEVEEKTEFCSVFDVAAFRESRTPREHCSLGAKLIRGSRHSRTSLSVYFLFDALSSFLIRV